MYSFFAASVFCCFFLLPVFFHCYNYLISYGEGFFAVFYLLSCMAGFSTVLISYIPDLSGTLLSLLIFQGQHVLFVAYPTAFIFT